MRAYNKVGAGSAASVSATPKQPNRAPSVSGSAAVNGDENKTDSLGKYTGSDPDGDTLTWSVSGTDAGSFDLKASDSASARNLHFRSAPDYETKNSYQVWVKVSDGSLADSVDVEVSVNNVEEEGSVTLTAGTPPQVGTAVVAQLTDLDGGITGAAWQWQRRASTTSSWAAIGAGATGEAESYPELSSYRPVSGDVGWQLRATVRYRDGHGPNKSEEGTASAAVIGPPDAPRDLKAVAGNGQVALSWKAPTATGGSAITGYAYRYKETASSTWTQDWPTTASGTTTSQTVSSLTNGTAYTFEVRAYNKVGSGTAASVSATPQQPNRAPSVSGPAAVSGNENSTASLGTYTGSDPDGDTLTWSLAGTNANAFQLRGSGSSRTLHFRSAPNYETKSRYQVSVRVSDGSLSDSQSVSVSVTNVNEAPTVSCPSSASVAENTTGTVASCTASDPEGNTLTWSLTGTNASAFQLQGSGSSRTIRFRSAPNYEAKSRYQVSVRVSDGSLSDSESISVSVTNVNEAPTVSCPSSASVAENTTGTVASCTASDPEGNTLTWSLTGTNASAFQLQGSGSSRTIRFRSAPNYEAKSRYQVSVRVSDGSLSDSESISVSVTNVNETGSLALSGKMPPQVGSTLTARLSDPDGGLSNIRWAWREIRASGADDEGDAEPPAVTGANGQSDMATYTPTTPGVRIQVTVFYTDGHGPNRRLHRQTAPVIGKPGRPGNLSARPGNIYTRVDLSWTAAADNGSPITRYEYRYRRGTGSWSSWSSVRLATSRTVSGLRSGATYTFQVRAVNAVGYGTAAETAGTARAEVEEEPAEEEPAEEEQAAEEPAEEEPAEEEQTAEEPAEEESTEEEQTAEGQAEEESTEEESTEEESTEEEQTAEEPAEEESTEEEQAAEEPAEEEPAAKVALPDEALTALAAPNPFNPRTTLHVQLPASGPVRLTLYNVAGQVVHTLVDTALEAGYHTFYWDGRDQHGRPVTSGVYLYRLTAGEHILVGKMALIR